MLPPEVEQGVRRQFGILDAASRTEEGGAVLARKTANRRLREIQDRHRSNPTMHRGIMDLLDDEARDREPNEAQPSKPGMLPNSSGHVLKAGPDPTWRDRLADKAGEIVGGDSTHARSNYGAADALGMLPGVGQALGVNEAQHLSEQGSPVQAGILGALSLIPGGRGAKKPAEAALEAITREISELAPRYQQLFGKQFVSPRAPEGTPIDAVLKGEQQVLDELRNAVTGKEAAIASKPGMLTTPKITAYDREGEMSELLGQAKANPYVQAVPGRQGLPSKAEQEKLIKSFYDAGGKVPAGPWGRDPADYQKAVQGGFEAAQQKVQQLTAAKAAAKTPDDVMRLNGELKTANEQVIQLRDVITQLQKIILGGGS